MNTAQAEKAQRFYELHQGSEILVLPNAWDAITARLFEQAGFQALGTTSAGIAHSLGYREPEKISREEMLSVIKRIVDAVSIPVTADIEAGYTTNTQDIAETIHLVIEAGAVGVNIEDSPGENNQPLMDIEQQVERLKAAREAANKANFPFIINARTDVYLLKVGDKSQQFSHVITRANRYLEAGADCIFVPGIGDRDVIARLTQEIHRPINILANPGVPTTPALQQLGVKRVSTGSGPMRATLALVRHIANELLHEGSYKYFTTDIIPYNEVNVLFQSH